MVLTDARRLRVAIDLTQVDNQTLGSGQFRYAVDLVAALCALDAVDLTVFGSLSRPVQELRPSLDRDAARCHYVELPPHRGRAYYYRDVARLSWWLASHRVDVFHQVHTNMPPIAQCPIVVTVYHYFEHPVLFATRPYRYYLWALRRRAAAVIAISDSTRADVHQHFGVPLARMRTIHPGLSKTFVPVARAPSARPYLLSPYNLSPPKNLRSLILAWPKIAEGRPDLELVLYGQAHVTPEREAELERLLHGLPHAGRIRRVGHVTDEDLAALYGGCALFVFPTTVEGFGYPLLEAMAYGACCMTRNASAMMEIGGDAVRLVETLRPDDIAAAAIELLDNPIERVRLGQLAMQRAAPFTVERMARQTFECYLSVARRRGNR